MWISTFNIKRDVFDYLDSALERYDEAWDALSVPFLEAFRSGAVSVFVDLNEPQAKVLIDLIDAEYDALADIECGEYLSLLTQSLKLVNTTKIPRHNSGNSLGGWSKWEFLSLERRPYMLTYRGAMPPDMVRLAEQVCWDLGRARVPYITWRIGNPIKLMLTHAGGASGNCNWLDDHIVITAGPDAEGNKATLLHEFAHLISRALPPHGASFYRHLIGLFERYDVPMSYLNYGRETAAVRAGSHRHHRSPIKFPNDGRTRFWHEIPPPALKAGSRSAKRGLAKQVVVTADAAPVQRFKRLSKHP
jgi:hypothetical protein